MRNRVSIVLTAVCGRSAYIRLRPGHRAGDELYPVAVSVEGHCDCFATRKVIYPENRYWLWTLPRNGPKSLRGLMRKVSLADWRTSTRSSLPSDPETEADRTPRESLLARMHVNREPSNQSFEIDREATVCFASRRFFLLVLVNARSKRFCKPSCH
jgi:hypothetical protein